MKTLVRHCNEDNEFKGETIIECTADREIPDEDEWAWAHDLLG